ncbi:MAG: peptidoglycan-binding protein [Actinobacteria bacterium]|nr:peptidoglycan-binding protein [Actinomycetota bacterium]
MAIDAGIDAGGELATQDADAARYIDEVHEFAAEYRYSDDGAAVSRSVVEAAAAGNPDFAGLEREYANLWAEMAIRLDRMAEVDRIVERVVANEDRYRAVERLTRMPWFAVAIIHNLEASGNFSRHLHNGDPLTARTVHVPAGRPASGRPPFTWEVSAADALAYRGLDQIADWSVARLAFEFERYNGWGYRLYHPHVKSPYLWSFSNQYSQGKYVADGRWSETAVSQQCGAMVLLKRLFETGHADLGARTAVGTAPERDAAQQPAAPGDGDVGVLREVRQSLVAALHMLDRYDGNGSGLRYPAAEMAPAGVAAADVELMPGASGDDVAALQAMLRTLHYDLVVDRVYGPATGLAVRLFQREHQLVVDGVVGPQTWEALRRSTQAVPQRAGQRYWPLGRGYIITSKFGWRPGGFHKGTDFGWPGGSAGKPVFAVQSGTVIFSGGASGYGGPDPAGWLVIDSSAAEGGGCVEYGHIVRRVAKGDRVVAGQLIAHINPNTQTNGGVPPHLHLSVMPREYNPNAKIDPVPWLGDAIFPG